jgi:uncharacterized transporter YbjL
VKPSLALVDSIESWLDRNPKARELANIAVILVIIVASFSLGLSLRKVHSYTCFSYIQVDPVKGWLYPSNFLPNCESDVFSDNLSCSPGTQLYSYQSGILAGDSFVPEFKKEDYRYGIVSSENLTEEN